VARICEAIAKIGCCGPQYDKQFHLAIDASKTGTGVVLFYLGNTAPEEVYDAKKYFDEVEIVIFISFRLSDVEGRYSTLERETLAIVRAFVECAWMLRESRYPIRIYTDYLSVV